MNILSDVELSVAQAKDKVSFAHHYFLNVPGELTVCYLSECMHVRESGILKIFSGILNYSLATSWNEKTRPPESSSTTVSLVNIHALKIFVEIRLTILFTQHSK